MAPGQAQVLADLADGEEGDYYVDLMAQLAARCARMPATGETETQGDQALVALHYFLADCDWYIIEKDAIGGVHQAFGYAVLHGDMHNAELGYISITELIDCKAELDFYFSPQTLASLKLALYEGRCRGHS